MACYPFNSIASVTNALTTTWREVLAHGRPAHLSQPAPAILAQAQQIIGMERHLTVERETTEVEGAMDEGSQQ
jgi:hypothetical protein